MKKVFTNILTVICCMMMIMPVTVLAKESEENLNPPKEPVLINTLEWSAEGLTAISAIFGLDFVKILPSPTDKIILKEYLTEDDTSYYAKVNIVGSTLSINKGERPQTNYNSKIELYIPSNFTGTNYIEISTGAINVENVTSSQIVAKSNNGGIVISGYSGILSCESRIGAIIINDCIVKGSVYTRNGDIKLKLNDITGDFNASCFIGTISLNTSDTCEFKIAATTKLGKVINNFSDDFNKSDKEVTGTWGKNPKGTITLKTNNGSVKINKKWD